MSDSIQRLSAAAAEEATIKCPACGESWAPDTPGYSEAKEMLERSLGSYCPGCQFKVIEQEEVSTVLDCEDLNDVREFIRKRVYSVSDSVFSFNARPEFDYVAASTLAQFLYSAVPINLLKDLGINELADQLARDYNLQPKG